jgi:hypothetical protein
MYKTFEMYDDTMMARSCVCGLTDCTHIFVIVSVCSFVLSSDFRFETEDGLRTRFKTSFV